MLRYRSAYTLFLFLLFTVGCAPTASQDALVADEADPVRARQGMVASAQALATKAGLTTLKAGGNAVDAAVATGFALAVVYPRAGNLGGGGFMVLRLADGTVTTIGFREKAPQAATADMYLDAMGEYVPERSRLGHLASGVPGTVAGLLAALERYGTMSRAEVMGPAIRLADEGFRLSERQARLFNAYYDEFAQFPGSKNYFTKGDSTNVYQPGELFVQKDLAAVLKRVRDEGRAGFYAGRTADLIVAEMERGGGLITHEDLRQYEAVEREPVVADYRGYTIYGMGPPSSGGVCVVQLLNAVEPYDVRAMGHNTAATAHLMGEAMRRVYADRAQWLGDGDFVDVPVDVLTSETYMRGRMASFNPYHTDTSAKITHGALPTFVESTETTHYSVVDTRGNAVSTTTTINGNFGSKVAVGGAGFFLNNEMDDFSAKPGEPNMFGLIGSEANAIAPEKRMLSSMSPTVVEDPQGRLSLITGTPGGATIITTVYQIVLNVIDHGMDVQEAVAAGRVHHQWKPDVLRYEEGVFSPKAIARLKMRGWAVEEGGTWGLANGITVNYTAADTIYYGATDPRSEGVVLGY